MEVFSSIVSPLTKLTQKKVKFQRLDECEKIFEELKDRLTIAPIFTLQDGSDSYVIYCDASRVCLGCVLVHPDVFTDHKSIQYFLIQKVLLLHQRRWPEFLKDCAMNVLYQCGKANIVVDALRRLSMGSVAHGRNKGRNYKSVHRLACLGVCLADTSDRGAIVQNGSESSLVVEIKEKQDSDPILI
ncbi:hypothetical protein MTR67_002570 [Solanum verrucosum]|uniref:Reverse transcriptase/retrotransposon-derived protein RNase H-like domain-containing protein n=1 Tax=Solanum verrucosum TaxID=315347 RepID=A0AAF0PSP1_SOLVR|nr:hypothetical protein MTR67_002570 [Solanum verrucosum]